jgi:sugar phosphate isomerase/epimerase
MPRRLSLQLYSVRNARSLKDTLRLIAETGYREVEGYGGVYSEPKALAQMLGRTGLAMPTGHFGLGMLENERTRVTEIARTLGMRQIFAPYLAEEERPRSAAGWRKLGKRLAVIGEWLRGEGLGFGWHNHDFEFIKLPGGEIPMELMLEAAPLIDWECDVAWVARARANPLAWIRRYGQRITAVHVKDIAPKGQCLDEDGWADVGQGVLDWPKLFDALRNTRALHYVMEHDNPSDIARFARRSYSFVHTI